MQYARADVTWTGGENGVALSDSNAGIATNVTLKFQLGTALADTTDYLEIDLTDFTVDNTAAQTESNYVFTGTNVFMWGNDFVATESSGIVTITLTDVSNSLPTSQEITLVISGVATNLGAVADVEVKLRTNEETSWITDSDTDAVTVNAVTPTVALSDLNAGMTSSSTITCTTNGAIPSDGKIVFTIASDFGIDDGTITSNVTVNDGSSVAITSAIVSSKVITIILNETGGIATGSTLTVVIGSSSEIITNKVAPGGTSNDFTLATQDSSANVIHTGTDTVDIVSNTWKADPNGVALGTATAGDADQITLKFSSGTALAVGDTLIIDLSTDFSINNANAIDESKYTFSGTVVTMVNDGSDFTATEDSGVITFTLLDDAGIDTNEVTLVIDSTVITNGGATSNVVLQFKTSKQTTYVAEAETDAITVNTVNPTIVLDDYNISATASATISYTSDGAVASGGKIVFTLPAEFAISSGDQTSNVTVDDGSSVNVTSATAAAQVLTIVLEDAIANAASVNVIVGSSSAIITNSATSGASNNFTLDIKDSSDRVIQTGTKTVTILKAWKTGGTGVQITPTTAGDAVQITTIFQLGTALANTDTLQIDLSTSFDVYNTNAVTESNYAFTGDGVTMVNVDETDFVATEASGIITFTLAGDSALPAGTDITLVISNNVSTNLGAVSDVVVKLKTNEETTWITDPDTDAVTSNDVTPILSLDNTAISATATATITYTSDGALPSNGKIVVTVPNEFTFANDADISDNVTVNDGGAVTIGSAAVVSRVLTITLNDVTGTRGNSIDNATAVTIVIGSTTAVITNPGTSQTSNDWTVTTSDNSDMPIQTGTDTVDIGIIWDSSLAAALSSSNAGAATNITLKFRLGTALSAAETIKVDLGYFTVDNTAAETEANIVFTGTSVTMVEFVATEAGGVITATLAGSDSIPAETDITLVISSVATNLGAIADVVVGLETDYQSEINEAETDAITSNAVTPTVALSSLNAGATSSSTVTCTTNGAIPSDGKIVFTIASGFTIGDASITANVSVNDGSSVAITSADVASNVVTIVLNESGGIATGSTLNVIIGSSTKIITNPVASGVSNDFTLETKDSSDRVIQTGTDTVTITPAAATQLTFTVEDDDFIAGATSTVFTVEIQDVGGNPQSGHGGIQINLTTDSGSGNAKFSLTESGAAITYIFVLDEDSSTNFYYYDDEAAGTRTLTATDAAANLTSDTSTPIVYPATVNYLKVTGTASMTAGANNQLTVGAYDQYDNLCSSGVNNYTGSQDLTFSGPGIAPDTTIPTIETVNIGTQQAVTFSNGTTDGANLTLIAYKAEGTTVDVTDDSIDSFGAESYDLGLTVGDATADHVDFTDVSGTVTTISTQTAGTAITSLYVSALDTYDNVDTDYAATTVTIAAGTAVPGSAPDGTAPDYPDAAIAYASGIAYFDSTASAKWVKLFKSETVREIKADDGALTDKTSNTFTINDAGASILEFTDNAGAETAFGAQTAGTAFSTFYVSALDAYDNVDTDYNTGTVTIAAGTAAPSNAPDTTAPDYPDAALSDWASGIITFDTGTAAEQVTLYKAENAIQISAAHESLTTKQATAFNVNPDTALVIEFTTEPAGSVSGIALTTQPIVTAKDDWGNTDTNFTETITLSENDLGTLSGTLTEGAVSGVADFIGNGVIYTATVDQQTFQLEADDDAETGTDLTAVSSGDVTSDVVATKLIWTQNPASCTSTAVCDTQGIIQAQNADNILDSGFADTITIAVKTGDGSLVGTPAQGMTSGSLTTAGIGYTATADQEAFTLSANDAGTDLTEGVSGSVTANVVATKFLVTLSTYTPTAGVADTLTLTAADAEDITDTGYDPTDLTFSFLDSSVTALVSHVAPDSTAPTIPDSATVINTFSSGVADLTTFKLVLAEVLGAITVTDASLTGDSASVTVKHASADSFTVTPSTLTPDTSTTLDVTVTAKDEFGNTADGANEATAFTGFVFLTTNATAPIWYNPIGTVVAGGTYTFTSAVKFQTVESGKTITSQNSDATITGTSLSITVSQGGDVTPPTLDVTTPQYPANDAENVAITVDPYVDFSEAMDTTTLTTTTIKLCLVSDADCSSPIDANIMIGNGNKRAVLVHGSTLSNDTAYWIYVGTGVTDVAGNALEAEYGSTTASNFTTIALGGGSLAVTDIYSIESYAAAGEGWPDGVATTADGWSWTFYVTVPTTETLFEMKFDNWTSGDNSILVADNMRFYSAQAEVGDAVDSDSAIEIAATGTYSADMTIDAGEDLSATTAGIQIEVTVEMQIPADSSGGSYSTSYGVKSTAPAE